MTFGIGFGRGPVSATTAPGVGIKPAAPTGLEMMLRNLGLGEVIAVAQKLASDGTIEKIVQFADHAEGIVGRLAAVETALVQVAEIAQALAAISQAGGIRGPAEPGSGSDDAGPVAAPGRVRKRAPGKHGAVDGLSGGGHASGDADGDGSASASAADVPGADITGGDAG